MTKLTAAQAEVLSKMEAGVPLWREWGTFRWWLTFEEEERTQRVNPRTANCLLRRKFIGSTDAPACIERYKLTLSGCEALKEWKEKQCA